MAKPRRDPAQDVFDTWFNARRKSTYCNPQTLMQYADPASAMEGVLRVVFCEGYERGTIQAIAAARKERE